MTSGTRGLLAQPAPPLWIAGAVGVTAGCALVLAGGMDVKGSAVVIASLALLGLVPVVAYFPRLLERSALFALAFTLPISLKFHPVFRSDHLGGAIGIRISITEILLLMLLSLCARRAFGRGLRIWFDPWLLVTMSVYFALACLSTVTGHDAELGVFQLWGLLQAFALFLFLSNYLSRPERLRTFIAGALLGLILQSAVAVVQVKRPGLLSLGFLGAAESVEYTMAEESGGMDIDLPDVDTGTTTIGGEIRERPTGLLIHPNVLGHYLILMIPLALGAWLSLRSANHQLLALGGVGLSGAALYLSLSRSGWTGMAVAAFLAVVLSFWWRAVRLSVGRALALGGLGLVVAAALTLKAGTVYLRLSEHMQEAFEFRRDLAVTSWNMIQKHPLTGVGLNCFTSTASEFEESGLSRLKDYPVHNIYLLEMSENGVLGGLAFLALVGAVILRTLAAARRSSSRWRAVALLGACGVAGFWFAEISDFVYRIPILMTFLWAQVAVVLAISRLPGPHAEAA